MLQQDLLVTLSFASVISLGSMHTYWVLECHAGWEWLVDSLMLIWICAGMLLVVWFKLWIAKPTFNPGLSHTHSRTLSFALMMMWHVAYDIGHPLCCVIVLPFLVAQSVKLIAHCQGRWNRDAAAGHPHHCNQCLCLQSCVGYTLAAICEEKSAGKHGQNAWLILDTVFAAHWHVPPQRWTLPAFTGEDP